MLALWLGDFPNSSCRLAGKLLTEKSSSHFPAVPWQDKTLNPSHRMVLEAKEQVANGFPGRWRPHSCSREPFALLAAGTTPRRLPSALECLRNGDKAFKITTVTLKTRATFCVVRQGERRGGSHCPEGGHPPPGAGSPRAGEQGSAPGSTPRPPSKPGKEQDAETSRPGKLCFSNPRGCGVKERTGVSGCSGGDRSLRLQVNPTQPRHPASGSGGRLSAITPDVRQTRSSGVRKLSMRSGAWPPRPGTCRAQTGHACPQSPAPGQEDTPRPWVAHRPGEGQL